MSEQIKEIRITPDAVKKHAQTPVYAAFLEAIFNSIDADATEIEVAAINQRDAQMSLFDESEPFWHSDFRQRNRYQARHNRIGLLGS